VNWTMWSAIAEVVSSAAILITLVYVALEIRQNTAATQASTREGVMQAELGVTAHFVRDPELGLLMFKLEPLSEVEGIKLHSYLLMFARMREANFRQHAAGVLDDATWRNLRTSLTSGPLASRNGRHWWQNAGRKWFDREFTAELDAILNETPTLVMSFSRLFAPPEQ